MGIEKKTICIGKHSVSHLVLTNKQGMQIELVSWGATLVDIVVPDRAGCLASVALAYENWHDYESNVAYLGCSIGRVAGRIRHGTFVIDGKTYNVPNNHGEHHLHGGASAMSHRNWSIEEINSSLTEISVTFTYDSAPGENAYPGSLNLKITYALNLYKNEVSIRYRASCDEPTLCNLTNHTYFNLSGNTQRSIEEHQLQVRSRAVCAMDEQLLVTGQQWVVKGTDFDLNAPRQLKDLLRSADPRIAQVKGLDHYYIFESDWNAKEPKVVVTDKISGRKLSVFTDMPCAVLYSHNHANGEKLRYGKTGLAHDSLCIETQLLPHVLHEDATHPAALYPSQTYKQHTRWVFDIVQEG